MYVTELAAKESDECLACCWDIACLRRVECERVWEHFVEYRGCMESKSSTWVLFYDGARLIMLYICMCMCARAYLFILSK
jgi:hypothetical protein